MSAPTSRRDAPPLPAGPVARTLAPAEGTNLDPPDIDPPLVALGVSRADLLAWLWRWWERFRDGHGTLSAKGIAFYSFFGVLSGLVLAFTVVAQNPQSEEALTEVLEQALPGIVGEGGISPDQLEAVGTTLGIVGSVVLLYSAISIVRAVDEGVRLVYGVQYEPRAFLVKNLRLLGYLLLLTPLIGLSYTASSATAGLFKPVLAAVGIEGTAAEVLVAAGGFAVSTSVNAVVIVIVLSRLGGIRPQRWRWRAGFLGGAALALVQWGTTVFVAFTVNNPRYLSFGLPVAMLLLFYAMALVLLATAAFVATANEPDPVLAARRQQVPTPPRRRG